MLMRLLPAAVITAMIIAFISPKDATAQEFGPASSQKAVLVTGASTGIGRKIVRRQRLWNGFSSGLRECFCSS